VSRTKHSAIAVTRHAVDWNDLAWPTLQRLGASGTSPGHTRGIVHGALTVLRQAHRLGTVYANPAFTVRAPPGPVSREFIQQARHAQVTWLRHLSTILGSARQRKRMVQQANALVRQFEFTGILVVNGKHVHPQQWPRGEPVSPPQAYDLTGQTFGRLTVETRVPGGRWSCRCQCGRLHTVRAKHLLRGTIRSCGCLKAEVDQRRKARRENRRWFHSGQLR
jgi:hypothetical protein